MNDIFQDFAYCINASYVSDLQENATYENFAQFANTVKADSYPISSWNEMFSYVFGEERAFTSVEEIKRL